MYTYVHTHAYTVVRKLFDRKYFIDNKVQGKIFLWIQDLLKYLYLEYISLAIIHGRSQYCGGAIDHSKNH